MMDDQHSIRNASSSISSSSNTKHLKRDHHAPQSDIEVTGGKGKYIRGDGANKHKDIGVELVVQDAATIDNESAKIPTSPSSPVAEDRLRSRIDKFLLGYGLTPMGKAVALSWIQVWCAPLCWCV